MSKAKTVTEFPDLQGIEAEAFAWIVKLDSGEVSAEDHEAFREWRARSQRHREALVHACDFWGGLDQLRHLEILSEDQLSASGKLPVASRIRRRSSLWLFAAAAAAAVLAIGIGTVLWHQGPDSV